MPSRFGEMLKDVPVRHEIKRRFGQLVVQRFRDIEIQPEECFRGSGRPFRGCSPANLPAELLQEVEKLTVAGSYVEHLAGREARVLHNRANTSAIEQAQKSIERR